jgi:hypothetical protein
MAENGREEKGPTLVNEGGAPGKSEAHGCPSDTSQWLKLTLIPVEKITSLVLVPAIGGSVT